MVQQKALTLKQFRALSAAARVETLAQAAEDLGVTAPALSVQLKTLEANLGGEIMARGPAGRGDLTPIGREALTAADEIENIISRFARRVEALQAGKTGHVALCVVSTGKYFAPGLVSVIQKALPDIDLSLTIANRTGVISALEGRRVDLAIMGRPPRRPAVESALLGEHPHVMIAHPDHPLARMDAVPPAALLEETILCREPGSGTRILTERYLDRVGEGAPYDAATFDSNETIKQAVIAGLGVALISAHTIGLELEAGRLALLNAPGLPIVRYWHVVRRADQPLTPAAAAVFDLVTGLEGSFLPPASTA